MAQNHLKFGTYTAPDVDEDGYKIAIATTSTDNSGRLMRGDMKNSVLFSTEAYKLKWTDIPVMQASNILNQVVNKNEFDFFHFNLYACRWETSRFYAANFNAPVLCLKEGEEKLDELSFQVTSIHPL